MLRKPELLRANSNASSNAKWQRMMHIGFAILYLLVLPLVNYFFMTKSFTKEKEFSDAPQKQNANNDSTNSDSTVILQPNAKPIASFWWPSEESGGLIRKIHELQNPSDCAAPSTKFFVWRSKVKNEEDTRGLTAWAHSGASHLLHAFTDGDQLQHGSRVLINDEELWPMAKGCLDGPQTRECYFEPLTKCKLTDVDDMKIGGNKVAVLKDPKDEYDRTARTLYSSQGLWFRLTKDKYSWTGLPGQGSLDHSNTAMFAAALAYYFRPKPWLKKEIDSRLRRSIPTDLNPDRTMGVPIRRSDKCFGHTIEGSAAGELDCPSMEKYLEAVRQFLKFDPLIENVIVTSEDKAACQEFLEILKKEIPSLRVVLNVGDVQQGTGSGSKVESYVEGATNANVVASALTSMHLHLRAKYFVITSKSTWTSTIAVMARNYGFATEIFVIDIGRNTNNFSMMARRGCE